VTPSPQAASALLRKALKDSSSGAVCCARLAWSLAATAIELLNPDGLLGETVRRRAVFS